MTVPKHGDITINQIPMEKSIRFLSFKRLLIAEPVGGERTHARWAQERLGNSTLMSQDGCPRGILMEPWRDTSETMIDRYTSASRWWSSVTPVFLPGFDDDKQSKAEKLFLTAARKAALPSARSHFS